MDYKITTSEFFTNYEEDFSKNTYEIKSYLDSSMNNSSQLSNDKIKDLRSYHIEAQTALKQMELELMSLPSQTKNELSIRVRNYKNDLENLSRQINKAEQRIFDMKSGSLFEKDADPKEKFLKDGTKIYDQNKKIEEAKRNMLECEGTAVDIQRELYKNTGTLEKSLKNTKEVWNEFSKSNRLLTLINNRRIRNKMVLYIVMGLVFLAIFLIVYLNFS